MDTTKISVYMDNIIWKVYNNLTVIDFSHVGNNRCTYWKCLCVCWNECIAKWSSLKRNTKQSCWCVNVHRTHWMKWTKIYTTYRNIKARCDNNQNPDYKNYWWRWIKCERISFESFYQDMFPIYQEWLTIDRINNDWKYCKENCRRSTRKEQANNRRKSTPRKKKPKKKKKRNYWFYAIYN